MIMKYILSLIICCIFLVGCGHNSIQYSDGLGFETTFRPDSGNFGFVFRYGKILSAVVRQNTTIQVSGDARTEGTVQNSPNVKTNSILKIKIGEQSSKAKRDCILAEKQLN